MRLLKIDRQGRLSLTPNLTRNIPPFAILSHTWGQDDEEISYEDLVGGNYIRKAGFVKLQFCVERAQKDNLDHFWIDTCCIKKSDSAELQEAINSMFRWYHEAKKCYVYLSDIPDRKRNHDGSVLQSAEDDLWKSKWFTRGWTLQELIAPMHVEFFTRGRKLVGDKKQLATQIQETTGVPVSILLWQEEFSRYRIEDRMTWAQKRETARPEDKYYCMLGILDVSMPIIYGEKSEHTLSRLIRALADRYHIQELAGLHRLFDPSETCNRQTATRIRPDLQQQPFSSHQRTQKLLESLPFAQMDSRLSTIKEELLSTCSWIINHYSYKAWMDPKRLSHHHGFLWLSGKPGSGKSTLMKFVYTYSTNMRSDNEIVVSFFFNARGEELERVAVGLYRSLLYQILQNAPDLVPILEQRGGYMTMDSNTPEWTVDVLKALIAKTLAGLGNRTLKVFIDALDECDEAEVREMVHFFERVGEMALQNGVQIHTCFSSRHYPTISILHGLRLTLEDQKEHEEDLDKYIRNYLRAGHGVKFETVKAQVRQKANGIFMWVALVVNMLNKEFERGYIPAVERKLEQIPAGLGELFEDLVSRDSQNLSEFRLSVQWILFARNPLTPKEYYCAMVTALESGNAATFDINEIEDEFIERFVLNSSKGLAEVTKSKEPKIQFIHESVRDFLFKDGGLNALWPEFGSDLASLQTQLHDKLKFYCSRYSDLVVSSNEPYLYAELAQSGETRKMILKRYPFLKYSINNVFYHSDLAAYGVTQRSFFEHFDLQTWIKLSNLLFRYVLISDQNSLNTNLAYLFAENGFVQLMRDIDHPASAFQNIYCSEHSILTVTPDVSEGGKRFYDNALHAACNKGFADIVNTILQKHVEVNVRAGIYESALQAASASGFTDIVKLLLDNGADVNMPGGYYGSALQAASVCSSTDIVRLILDKGADVNMPGGCYGNALQAASACGCIGVVKLLLDNGADVNMPGGHYGSALQAASVCKFTDIVRLILDKGADVNIPGGHYGSALQAASSWGNAENVQLLLDYGADYDARNDPERGPPTKLLSYPNALVAAAGEGETAVIKLLLDHGAKVNSTHENSRYHTALHAAAIRGSAEVVQLLLERGADINIQGSLSGSVLECAEEGSDAAKLLQQMFSKPEVLE